MAKKTLVDCPKCDGRGKIDFSSRAQGRCFCCAGAGKVSVDSPSASQALRLRAAEAGRLASECLAALVRGNQSDAAHYAERAACAFHKVGSDLAREQLRDLRARGLYQNERGQTRKSSPALALRAFRMVCDAGRA